jgi:hypothetical protein
VLPSFFVGHLILELASLSKKSDYPESAMLERPKFTTWRQKTVTWEMVSQMPSQVFLKSSPKNPWYVVNDGWSFKLLSFGVIGCIAIAKEYNLWIELFIVKGSDKYDVFPLTLQGFDLWKHRELKQRTATSQGKTDYDQHVGNRRQSKFCQRDFQRGIQGHLEAIQVVVLGFKSFQKAILTKMRRNAKLDNLLRFF